MRGEIGKPRKQPASEKGKGKRYRREAEGRKRRTFSCTRLYGVDDVQTTSLPVAQQRDVLLAKAKYLAFPADATGKYKQPSVRKLYARDVSAGGSSGLPAFHKSALDSLLNDLLLRYRWPKVAGVLSVLLRPLLAERDWSTEYSQYFWAAMEVTRQLEGLTQGNDFKFRKMYQIFLDKQPKGPWSRSKADAGVVRLELALHLLSQGQFEDANLASEPFMDVPPYRDHSLANLVHGLIHYYQWFNLIKQKVEQELGRVAMRIGEKEDVDFSEGVGENDNVFNHSYKADHSNDRYTFRLDDDLHSEETSTLEHGSRSSQMLKEPVPHIVKEETLWNIYDDADEDIEKGYIRKARVLYNKDLDEKLFPFKLPRQYWGKDYVLSTQTATQKNSHSIAVKHLRDALSLENNSTAALLPLVQLLLAGADIEGTFSEIDKCCKKFSDCTSFSYGMPGTNVGMAGFLQPYAQNTIMTGRTGGNIGTSIGTGLRLLNALACDNLTPKEKPRITRKEDKLSSLTPIMGTQIDDVADLDFEDGTGHPDSMSVHGSVEPEYDNEGNALGGGDVPSSDQSSSSSDDEIFES
ncbi:hypothetical protein L7F22_027531 [Adiantum nelumboides]|nr:hypothetical protein [Adiantum nelumboides]